MTSSSTSLIGSVVDFGRRDVLRIGAAAVVGAAAVPHRRRPGTAAVSITDGVGPMSRITAISIGPSASSTRVQRSGTALTLGGNPYRLTGFNMWRAAITTWNHPANYDGYEQNTGSNLANDLANVHATAPHVNAIRVWFFQQFALNGGVRDFSAMDKVLSVADAAGVKVVASLQDQWSYEYNGTQGGLTSTWFNTTYSSAVTNSTYETVPYRQWVSDIVNHYKNDARIVMWEFGNEMDAMTPAFATDVGALIKSIDPGVLVGTGFAVGSTVQPSILDVSTVDVASFHYYTDYSQTDYPSTASAALSRGKPTIIGECGFSTTGATRANSYNTLLSGVYSTQGMTGFLAWQWNGTGGGDAFNIGTGDPMLPVLDSFH